MSSDAVTRVSVEIAGSEISFETGRMAKQASGAVVVRQGDTMVLATAVAGETRDVDFLPLTVDVEERMYAAGKIPGSFFKREGRPGEKGTLTARMIDRPLRPLFPEGWRHDTQLVAIPLSIDHVHPYDILAMNGASAAVMVSDIPFPTPVGAVRIGKIDGNFVVNPDEGDLLGEARPRTRADRPGSDRGRYGGGDPDGRGRRRRRCPRRRSWTRWISPTRPSGRSARAARAGREGRQGEETPGRGARGGRGAAGAGPIHARRGAGRGDPDRGQARASGGDGGGRGRRSWPSTRRPRRRAPPRRSRRPPRSAAGSV